MYYFYFILFQLYFSYQNHFNSFQDLTLTCVWQVFAELKIILCRVSEWTSNWERENVHHVYFLYFTKKTQHFVFIISVHQYK